MDPKVREKIVYAHGGLMIFVWMVAVPFAVAANMYARKTGKTWGPKVHMTVMAVAAFMPSITAYFMALTAAGGEIKIKPHSLLGTLLAIVSYMQMLFGIVNHLVYRYRKKNNALPSSRPWNNHVHIWLGRVLLLTAAVNIPLGMKIKRAPIAAYILYALWLLGLVVLFTWLFWMKPQESVDDDNESFEKPQQIENTSSSRRKSRKY